MEKPLKFGVLSRLWVCIAAALVVLAGTAGDLAPRALAQSETGEGGVGGQEPAAAARAVAQKPVVHPGETFAIAVVLEHGKGFHSWPNKPVIPKELGSDFAAIPTTIEVPGLPAGARVVGIQWPPPTAVKVNFTGTPIDLMSYPGQMVAYVAVALDPTIKPGPAAFKIKLAHQACNDSTCLQPETFDLSVTVEVAAPGLTPGTTSLNEPDLFQAFDLTVFQGTPTDKRSAADFNVFGWKFSIDPNGFLGFGLLLLVAALGGLVLNLTPCVLPVIPIKILGLSQAAGNPGRCFLLGVVMSAGVVVFWLGIGSAMSAIAGFKAVNTLFQHPWFPTVIGVIIAVMAMGMFGLFTARLPNWVYAINPSQETLHGAFLFGVMTAVLSTPCLAPFMGGAAAWAATQTPAVTITTFAAIGVGMATPYLLLSANPRWVSKVPRTGPGSELVKHVIGLLMLAVAAFFLGTGLTSILAQPTQPPSRAYWWLVGGFILAAGLLLTYRTVRLARRPATRVVFTGLGFLVSAAGVFVGVVLSSHGPINWQYYTPTKFEEAKRRGDVIVMDFTAEWCLNCKALESGVLHRSEIVALLNKTNGVVPMKVDLSGNNADGQAKLRELHWVGIPLLAVFGPGVGYDKPILYDSYTPDMVQDAVARARSGTARAAAPP